MATGKISITEGSDKNIASHSFTEDSETKHVERVAPGAGVVTIPGTAQVSEQSSTGTYPASAIDITGKAGIVIKSSFSVSTSTCKVKVLFLDSSGAMIGLSDEYTIPNSESADGSRYLGGSLLVDNRLLGASGVKIVITEAPASGNVSFYVAGI
jgi:hypothetical protein